MLNSLFPNFNSTVEQNLLEDLGIEMIQIHGMEVYYLQRSFTEIDEVFFEDPASKFLNATPIEVLMKTYEGYGGQSDLMSKFGMSMTDRMEVTVSRKRWSEEFPNIIRPFEGDLIWIPMTNALFEIKFVEHEDNFYQHGTLQYFDLRLERFTYSSETIQVGIDKLDQIEDRYAYKEGDDDYLSEDDQVLEAENGEDLDPVGNIQDVHSNETFSDLLSTIIDTSDGSAFSEPRG